MAPGMDSFKSPCSPVTSSCLIFETFTFLCTAGHRARFSVTQVYAKGSRSGSLKRPRMGLPIGCQLIPALNCLVFLRKPLFRRQTNTRTDRRTDRQANRRTTSLRTASAFASRGLMIGQARYKLSGGPYIVSVVSLQWSRLWDVNSHQTLCWEIEDNTRSWHKSIYYSNNSFVQSITLHCLYVREVSSFRLQTSYVDDVVDMLLSTVVQCLEKQLKLFRRLATEHWE